LRSVAKGIWLELQVRRVQGAFPDAGVIEENARKRHAANAEIKIAVADRYQVESATTENALGYTLRLQAGAGRDYRFPAHGRNTHNRAMFTTVWAKIIHEKQGQKEAGHSEL